MDKRIWKPLAMTLAVSAASASYAYADVDIDNDGLIEISTLQQLDLMRYDLAGTSLNGDSTGCPATGCNGYELVADLDFDTNGNGVADEGDLFWNNGEGWEPVGQSYYWAYAQKKVDGAVTANFDGNGFSIINLHINRPNQNWVGLFTNIHTGYISNVVFINADVTGYEASGVLSGGINNSDVSYVRISDSTLSGHDEVGLLSGRYYGNGNTIQDINVSGSVQGNKYTGGVIGWATRDSGSTSENYNLQNIISEVDISAGYYSGGVIGIASGLEASTVISQCTIDTGTYGLNYVGGVFGSATSGSISNIIADCEVSGMHQVGGIAGIAGGLTINKVYVSVSSIVKGAHPGGLAGEAVNSTISDSRVLGLVQGKWNASGVSYKVRGDVSVNNVYVAPSLVVTHKSEPERRAGLIREIYYTDTTLSVSNTYWDIDATGTSLSLSGYGEGKTTFELQCPTMPGDVTCDASMYSGWDDTIWDFGTSSDYPVLR